MFSSTLTRCTRDEASLAAQSQGKGLSVAAEAEGPGQGPGIDKRDGDADCLATGWALFGACRGPRSVCSPVTRGWHRLSDAVGITTVNCCRRPREFAHLWGGLLFSAVDNIYDASVRRESALGLTARHQLPQLAGGRDMSETIGMEWIEDDGIKHTMSQCSTSDSSIMQYSPKATYLVVCMCLI